MMSTFIHNPRSALHSLPPEGAGTAQVESLVSYFCRLAGSHSTSVTALAKVVSQAMGSEFQSDFDWRDRNLSGIGASAVQWSSALAALTGVERLDQLTLSRWSQVLAPRGLMAPSSGKWCPHCLDDDRHNGKTPYFRLAWDLKVVNACERHRIELACVCPDCGQTSVRHKSAYVIPGWCTRCQVFLGSSRNYCEATPAAVWVTEQVGKLLSVEASMAAAPELKAVQQTLTTLVIQMNRGNSAAFGARVGVAKSTVHCWTHGKTSLTLETALRISSATGLPLEKLLCADLNGWTASTDDRQLDLNLELGSRQRAAPDRSIDWRSVRAQLMELAKEPRPISLAEAARRLNIDASYLYLHVNKEARTLSTRWQAYAKCQSTLNRREAREAVVRACRQLRAEGRSLSMREVRNILTPEELAAAKHLIDMITEIKFELDVI